MAFTPEMRAKAQETKRRHREMAAQQQPEETVSEPAPVMPGLEGDDWSPDNPLDPVAEPGLPPTPYELFLSSLSDETRELLDEAELREAFDAATREANAERKKRLKAGAAAKAKDQARAVAGLLPAEELAHREWQEKMSRKVRWTPILPFVDGTTGLVDDGLLIDGRRLYHNQEVETTYGEWLSCRSILWNLRQHELDFKGEGRLSSLRRDVNARGISFSARA